MTSVPEQRGIARFSRIVDEMLEVLPQCEGRTRLEDIAHCLDNPELYDHDGTEQQDDLRAWSAALRRFSFDAVAELVNLATVVASTSDVPDWLEIRADEALTALEASL